MGSPNSLGTGANYPDFTNGEQRLRNLEEFTGDQKGKSQDLSSDKPEHSEILA